jgi:hypothetical protein
MIILKEPPPRRILLGFRVILEVISKILEKVIYGSWVLNLTVIKK